MNKSDLIKSISFSIVEFMESLISSNVSYKLPYLDESPSICDRIEENKRFSSNFFSSRYLIYEI